MATITSDVSSLAASATAASLASLASVSSAYASATAADPDNINGRNLTYTSSTYAMPTKCSAILDQHRVYVIPEGDADIAGIGVIVAFLASAGLVLIAALISYYAGLIHKDLLNIADRRAYHARSNGSENWRGAVDKFILVFSDQQILTGIALLVAGFAQWKTINVYHWQMVLYLAWMSSNTHLTTLTVLKPYLQQRYTLKTWRITGMGILLIMLLVGFVPTSSESWLLAVSKSEYYFDGRLGLDDFHSAGNPAHCYWQGDLMKGINIDAPFSYCIILCSYIWKASSLYDNKGRARRWYRHAPLNFLGRSVLRNARKIPHDGFTKACKPRVFWYRIVLAQYCGWMVIIDFLESFLASLWALAIYFVWGALVLFTSRGAQPQETRDKENKWSFGQILPLTLLVLPLVAVLEHFYRDKEPNESAEIREFRERIMNRKEVDFNQVVSHTEVVDDYSPVLVEGTRLSGYFKRLHFATTPEQETLQREFFYKSWFFLSCHFWINLLLLGGSVGVFYLQGRSLHYHVDSVKGNLWGPLAVVGFVAYLLWVVWMTLGMFTSKLFR